MYHFPWRPAIQEDVLTFPEWQDPANTKHLYNIYTMLDQRRRRWAALYKCYTNGLCLLDNLLVDLPSFVCYVMRGKRRHMCCGYRDMTPPPPVKWEWEHCSCFGNKNRESKHETFIQRQPNIFDFDPTLYKCHTNVLCLPGRRFPTFFNIEDHWPLLTGCSFMWELQE